MLKQVCLVVLFGRWSYGHMVISLVAGQTSGVNGYGSNLETYWSCIDEPLGVPQQQTWGESNT